MSEGMKKRMIVVLVIFFVVALGITGKLGYEQLFNASKLESVLFFHFHLVRFLTHSYFD